MIRPRAAKDYPPIDLKLGIKSSLPGVRSTLALLFLMWELTGRPAGLEYCHSKDNRLELKPDIETALYEEMTSLGITSSPDQLHELLAGNCMLSSQLESLIVAFELIWKVARIYPTEDRQNGAERTGGLRYPKRLAFTSNMDLFHALIRFHREAYLRTLFAWLGVPAPADPQAEEELTRFLTVIAEGAFYKLVNGGEDVIFNMESLYATILAHDGPVDINGDVESRGALRILKSALSQGLFTNMQIQKNQVSAKDAGQLSAYHARVAAYHQICVAPATQGQAVPADEPVEDGDDEWDAGPQQALRFVTGLQSEYPRNRIVFGAPGTGKSFLLDRQREDLLGEHCQTNYERVTFHPDYSYANFVGTYKPVMVGGRSAPALDEDTRQVLAVLTDQDKPAQEKYDLLYDRFNDGELTRLPILLGLYTDEKIKTRKSAGDDTADDNASEQASGRAIRKYVSLLTGEEKAGEISYEYVPGPFMRVYVDALKSARTSDPKPYLLIIEEINRAQVAAVFGEVFQLLDRGDDQASEYPIQATEDVKKYLARELGGRPEDYTQIRIPDNMFIWATMNSADQGVFPMDTAFKRRWDFTYLGIDDNDGKIRGKYVYLAEDGSQKIEWNKLRKAINRFLAREKINEDKQLGPYFLSKSVVAPEDGDEIDRDTFIRMFQNKVIMYLFEDAARQKRDRLFEGCAQKYARYSEICAEFEKKGIGIFHHDIQNEAAPERIQSEE